MSTLPALPIMALEVRSDPASRPWPSNSCVASSRRRSTIARRRRHPGRGRPRPVRAERHRRGLDPRSRRARAGGLPRAGRGGLRKGRAQDGGRDGESPGVPGSRGDGPGDGRNGLRRVAWIAPAGCPGPLDRPPGRGRRQLLLSPEAWRDVDRFVDEVQGELARRGRSPTLRPVVCGLFGDLVRWSDAERALRAEDYLRDPAFLFETPDRWIAFQRVQAQMRYYFGPKPRPGFDHDDGLWELGSVATLGQAVDLAAWFVGGTRAPEDLAAAPIRSPFRGSRVC